MFTEVRRTERKINKVAAIEILNKGEYGILSTVGEDGYAYGVPLSYVYMNDGIYFHCATEGHKLENINFNKKGSFCVVGDTEILAEKFSTKYESVIAFGIISEVVQEEKEQVLLGFIEKYSANYMEQGKAYIINAAQKAKVMKLCVQHLSGKARK